MTCDVKCVTCHRDPARMHSAVAECSHCECPHRKTLTAAGPGQEWLDLSELAFTRVPDEEDNR